jgi:acetyl esterase/lipase
VPNPQSEALAAALQGAGVSARLELVEGAQHIFGGHDDIDTVVQMSVDYLAEALTARDR